MILMDIEHVMCVLYNVITNCVTETVTPMWSPMVHLPNIGSPARHFAWTELHTCYAVSTIEPCNETYYEIQNKE